MRMPGIPAAIKSEELYRRLGRLLESTPAQPDPTLSTEFMRWVAQANALIDALGNVVLTAEAQMAITGLHYPDRKLKFEKLILILHKALALAELKAPPGAQGAFIPVGNSFDAFAALSKILGAAQSDVLLVDPYLDESVLTDFAGSIQESVPLRLLTDQATVKPSLAPAVLRWQMQYASRPLEARRAASKTLHDRAIFIDGAQAWTVTQSLKDLAKRSPAEIVRADDTASLKIAAYEAIWASATVIK